MVAQQEYDRVVQALLNFCTKSVNTWWCALLPSRFSIGAITLSYSLAALISLWLPCKSIKTEKWRLRDLSQSNFYMFSQPVSDCAYPLLELLSENQLFSPAKDAVFLWTRLTLWFKVDSYQDATDEKTLEKKFDLRLLKKYKDHWCCVPVVAVKPKASNLSRWWGDCCEVDSLWRPFYFSLSGSSSSTNVFNMVGSDTVCAIAQAVWDVMQLRKRYQSPAGLRNRQHVSVFWRADACRSRHFSQPQFFWFFSFR